MAYYPAPNNGGGGGGLGTAMNLWNMFRSGGTIDQGNASLANTKAATAATQQGTTNAAAAEARAAELHPFAMSEAQTQQLLHANELANSNLTTQDRMGAVKAYQQMGDLASIPTTAMSADQLDRWKKINADQGVQDMGEAATAHNRTVGKIFGRYQPLDNSINTGAQMGPDGGVTVTAQPGLTPSDMSVFGGGSAFAPPVTPPQTPAPAPGGASPVGPVAFSPPVTAPAVPQAAPAQTNMGAAPLSARDFANLSPRARALYQQAQEIESTGLANQEKKASLIKSEREQTLGTEPERDAHKEFSSNAAELSHRLGEFTDVMGEWKNHYLHYGGDGDPEARAMRSALPLLIADNFSKITNPKGVLRAGNVELAKNELIPVGAMTADNTTQAAINYNKKILADYVRNYENLPSTKQPVEGMTTELRQMVGPTKFGKPEDIYTSDKAQSQPQQYKFDSQQEYENAVKAGQVDPKVPAFVLDLSRNRYVRMGSQAAPAPAPATNSYQLDPGFHWNGMIAPPRTH